MRDLFRDELKAGRAFPYSPRGIRLQSQAVRSVLISSNQPSLVAGEAAEISQKLVESIYDLFGASCEISIRENSRK